MNKIFKLIHAVVVITIIAVVVSGCGSKGKIQDVATTSAPTEATTAIPTDAPTTTPKKIYQIPANPNASVDAKKVLNYLAYLSTQTTENYHGIISGQNAGHGNDMLYPGQYDYYIEDLYEKTGKYPGILDIDYEYAKEFTVSELKEANIVLKDYWKNGGLIQINISAGNPWGNSLETGTSPEIWGLMVEDNPDVTEDYSQLLPGGDKRIIWLAKLDRIASGLQDLEDAGVVVMWRPMQEMNAHTGNFWWDSDNAKYVEVWKDMFNYFTNTKGLDNLLWVWSPVNSKYSDSNGQWGDWSAYPGDAYVDIVAGTQYFDTLLDEGPEYDGYDRMTTYNKAIGMAEWGRGIDDDDPADGQWDNMIIQDVSRNIHPKLAYFMMYSSWADNNIAIIDNLNASELMNHPDILTRDELQWKDY